MAVYTRLIAQSIIRVNRIVIKIGCRGIASDDWKPCDVTADEEKYVNFNRPNWLSAGKHEAKLIAFTPEGYSKSKKFIIEVKE